MEPSLLGSYKLYTQICQATIRYIFTQVSDKSFPNLVIEFYVNLRIVGTSLRSLVRGVEIDIHKDNFRRIFELPFEGKSNTYKGTIGLNNFKHSTALIYLVIKLVEIRNFPL